MQENSSEKHEKKAKKILKNRANPRGMGVMRFSLLEILFLTPLPLTVTEIEAKMCEAHGQVNKRWVRQVITEMQQFSDHSLSIKFIEKRVGDTKAPAYYINKPKPQPHV